VASQDMRAVFVEYAWNIGYPGGCDPCSAPPIASKELVELGARWVEEAKPTRGSNAFVTRLHVRYDAGSFPEDIAFEETADPEKFQGRYVLHHPWRGDSSCQAAQDYRAALPAVFARQADNLVALTGWSRSEIEARMAATGQSPQSQ
jgi:hypothetical protein